MTDTYTEHMRRNVLESERLEEQSELLDQNIGYLLHPSVRAKLPPSPVIADVGTGTACFVLKLAKLYPAATLHGFDISDTMFPTTGKLPANVSLTVMDVKADPPREQWGKYDMVHCRLLSAGMSPGDWEPAVFNLMKLLKPDGALQWEECNWANVQHLRGETTSSVSSARFMGAKFKEALATHFSYGWNTLPHIFLKAGLSGVASDIVSSDRLVGTREAFTKNGMRAIFGWAKMVSDRGMPYSIPMDELLELEDKAYQDIESGCYVRFDIHVALGFKYF